MKELEEDAKREPDERLPRVRDHIVERYEIEHEDDDYTSHNRHIDRQHNEEKAAFEKEKTDVLSKVDGKTRDDFLAVGFARWSDVLSEFDGKTIDDFLALGFDRWSKTYLPCIQLGPYDVPPDGFRDSWMKMRSTVSLNILFLFYWPIYIVILSWTKRHVPPCFLIS